MPFKKGEIHSTGRPKGSPNVITAKIFEDLLKEIKVVEKDKKISQGKTILRHFIERAYKNDTVLCAFMKKLVADKNYNIEDFQNANIKVTFEIIDSKKEEEKINEAEIVQVLIENNQNDDQNERDENGD